MAADSVKSIRDWCKDCLYKVDYVVPYPRFSISLVRHVLAESVSWRRSRVVYVGEFVFKNDQEYQKALELVRKPRKQKSKPKRILELRNDNDQDL